MEREYPVSFSNQPVGKVRLSRQGLYCRFQCRCQLSGEVVCRLWATWGRRRVRLGVVVPMDGGFGLDTRLPAKTLGEGEPTFTLAPSTDLPPDALTPPGPQEPYSYIERLKQAYLARKAQQGIFDSLNA